MYVNDLTQFVLYSEGDHRGLAAHREAIRVVLGDLRLRSHRRKAPSPECLRHAQTLTRPSKAATPSFYGSTFFLHIGHRLFVDSQFKMLPSSKHSLSFA